ncbi:MAG: PstS family phosphate ABC transporter substrate-binding protein [Vicingaceae bacterium]
MITACGGNDNNNGEADNKEDQLTGEIKIDGSSTVYPITEAVAEEFRMEAPEVKVTVGVSGTGGGFKKFTRGEIDINDASRPIKESEAEQCKQNNIEYVGIEVAYDGLAVIKNPENDWLESITVEELKKIWEPAAQGVITKWNQIRAEWPDEEIHLFGPGVASGTYDYFTEAINGESGASRGDYTASEDDNVLVQGIATDKYALGFFGLAYYEENKDKLALVAVDGGEGPILPSLETVNGTYKPLSRPIFIYVSSKAAQRKEVVEFVNFYLEMAPELSKEVGYIPLLADEYNKQKEKFDAFLK